MLKFGCDPEFFAVIEEDGKEYATSPALLEKFSGINFLYQDKAQKHPVYIDNKDFSWMQDGVAFELTTKYPVETPKEMYNLINNSLESLNEYISKIKFKDFNLSLYKQPVVNLNPNEYLPFISDDKIFQGFIFGCDPDMDAIETEYRCKTVDVMTHEFRYGGGHIHISGEKKFRDFIIPAIKLQALTVGNFVIANSPYPEKEKQRATTYGRPGRYRPQKYSNGEFGIEYRTPSNSWTSFSLEKYEELFSWAEKGVKLLNNPKLGEELLDNFLDDTIIAITNAEQTLSKNILTQIGDL